MFVDIVNMSYMACDLGFTGEFNPTCKCCGQWGHEKLNYETSICSVTSVLGEDDPNPYVITTMSPSADVK